MLDKRTSKFLLTLARICEDGSYKIIEKTDLGKDIVAMDQMVRYLSDNEMIDVKYTDETVYCLTMLPKGRVLFEGTKKNRRTVTKIERKVLIILILGCFAASLLGSMLGSYFAGLMG